MPTFVNPTACNACADEHQGPLCVYICPNDLMALDIEANKGFNQEPQLCSECYACVKLCPSGSDSRQRLLGLYSPRGFGAAAAGWTRG